MRMHALPMLSSLSLPVLTALPAQAAQPVTPEEALRQYRQAEDGFDLPLCRPRISSRSARQYRQTSTTPCCPTRRRRKRWPSRR
jgi:hypothetical protein